MLMSNNVSFYSATGFLVIAGDLIKSLVDWLEFEGTTIDNRWLNVTIMTTVIVLPLYVNTILMYIYGHIETDAVLGVS